MMFLFRFSRNSESDAINNNKKTKIKFLYFCLTNKILNSLFSMQEAKTSFFQRQFCSGLKLFRNFISWQGILSDSVLKELAISSLLNRYLLSAMRVCTPTDSISKAYTIVNTLPRIWLHPDSGILESMDLFVVHLRHIVHQLDKNHPHYA